MLEEIYRRAELQSLQRRWGSTADYCTVKAAEVEQLVAAGWSVEKELKRSVRLRRKRPKSELLESRVWLLLFKLGFPFLSGHRGGILGGGDAGAPTQFDAVAIDDEVALAIECKSSEQPRKDQLIRNTIARVSQERERFARGVRSRLSDGAARQIGTILFLWDLIPTDNDLDRAKEANVIVFDEAELSYYEQLVSHIGHAARYQFLGDVFAGKSIPGLVMKLPALQTRIGPYTWYTFSMKPDDLLKIAFVSHRAKAKATDIDAYQRMVAGSRLRDIRKYIAEDGFFPTNIVVNIEAGKRRLQFDQVKQEGGTEGARYGWLTIRPAYKSAWIIDGQHRLFAYAGTARATKDYLNVVAFDGLAGAEQAQLFVDINGKQKGVKRSLLQELWAILHWESEDENRRLEAVVSKSVQALHEQRDSPFYGRIQLGDSAQSKVQCISITSLMGALTKGGFYIVKRHKDRPTEYGALWGAGNEATMKRTIEVLKVWFTWIREAVPDWWALGKEQGGGIAMNDSVVACISVLRSVLEHLEAQRRLNQLTTPELIECIKPYGTKLGASFAKLSAEERLEFRSGRRGVEGQTWRMRKCQQWLNEEMPAFEPSGLIKWIEQQKSGNNEKARLIIEQMETNLLEIVVGALKENYGELEDAWWHEGVPLQTRQKIDERINETKGRAGKREQNFDLVHYKLIATTNWHLFEHILGFKDAGKSKDKQTEWIDDVARMRNKYSHPTRREHVTDEELSRLERYQEWFELVARGSD